MYFSCIDEAEIEAARTTNEDGTWRIHDDVEKAMPNILRGAGDGGRDIDPHAKRCDLHIEGGLPDTGSSPRSSSV